MTLHINDDGWIKLPRDIRQVLGITGDDLLDVIAQDGIALLMPYISSEQVAADEK